MKEMGDNVKKGWLLNKLSRFFFIGTKNQSKKNIRRVLAINTIALSASVASILYLFFYIYLREPLPIAINIFVLFLYNATILLNYKNRVDFAAVWVMSVYSIHVFTMGEIIFASPT
jgi:hypothetical protein